MRLAGCVNPSIHGISLSRFEYICRDPEGTFCARLNPHPLLAFESFELRALPPPLKKTEFVDPFHPSVWIHPFIFISRKCVNVSRPFLLCDDSRAPWDLLTRTAQ
jgi:hypothetical protein